MFRTVLGVEPRDELGVGQRLQGFELAIRDAGFDVLEELIDFGGLRGEGLLRARAGGGAEEGDGTKDQVAVQHNTGEL